MQLVVEESRLVYLASRSESGVENGSVQVMAGSELRVESGHV